MAGEVMPDQVDWRSLEREASPGRAVGRLLRDQREACGLDLGDVEKSLRIRRSNLEAIEEGRFDKLPGAAYIPAFLRAYASHVGLDPEKVLTAYHLSGAVPIKRPVALPADFPIVEKRAPIGLAVLTVLLVLCAGYAAWQYLPRDEAIVAEKVPPVPDRLLASPPPASSSTEEASSSATSAGTAFTTTATNVPPSSTEGGRPVGSLPTDIWPVAPRRDAAAAAPPAQPQVAPLAPPIVIAVPPPPPPPVVVPAIGQAQAAQPPAQSEQPRVTTQEPAQIKEEAVARLSAAEAPGGASPPVRFDTPVTVRANSWIELRAPNGDVLAQTYVRAGESYVVPAGIAYRIVDAR